MYEAIITARIEHQARTERLTRHFQGVAETYHGHSPINLSRPIGNLLGRLSKINLQNERNNGMETVSARSTGEWRQPSLS